MNPAVISPVTQSRLAGLSSSRRDLIGNASSLLATTAVTSLLGLIFWGVAARFFSTQSVGAGSAAVSAMTLLGTFGMFGVGTVLIGQLGRTSQHAVETILAALIVVAVGSAVLGLLGALALPLISASLKPFASGPVRAALFAFGVVTTSVSFVLDQALIGLLRGGLQLWRNAIFSVIKLGLLVAVAATVEDRHGVAIYATWVLGNVASFGVLWLVLAKQGISILRSPRWSTMRSLRGAVLTHSWLNGALQAPRLLLPVLVVALISPEANATFYVAYLVASMLYMVPTHLSTVLYAVGVGNFTKLRDQTRFSLAVSGLVGAVGCVVLAVGAPLVLGLFGHAYAARASAALRILALGVFPTTIKVHFVALCRVGGRITRGGILMTLGGVFELSMAALGVSIGGLTGLSVALVAAMSVVALFVVSDVRRVTCYVGPAAPDPPRSERMDSHVANGPDPARTAMRAMRHAVGGGGTGGTAASARTAVSVIICAYSDERWDCLLEAVHSCRDQTVTPLEVVVVIDHNDSLYERVRRELADVVVMKNRGERGAGGARNMGVEAARGGIVAFLDDDAVATADWVEMIQRRMAVGAVLGVGGEVVPRWLAPQPRWFPDEFGWVVGCSYRGLPEAPSPVRNLIAANMAVGRETFLAIGGFRRGHGNLQFDPDGATPERRARFVTRQSGCEETDFCIRALTHFPGRDWLYDPDVRIHHRVPAARSRWSYFLARCHDEGLAKATVVVEFSGTKVGLESERAYIRRTLPTGLLRGVASALRGDMWGLARAGAILLGLATAAFGYARGRMRMRLRSLLGASTVALDGPGLGDS